MTVLDRTVSFDDDDLTIRGDGWSISCDSELHGCAKTMMQDVVLFRMVNND